MKLTRAEQLFQKAYEHNWDSGVAPLQRMLAKPECDKATALLIYWHASPGYYNRYRSLDEVPAHERPVVELIRRIESLLAKGELPEPITYSPPADRIPEELGHIPPVMLEGSRGPRDSDAILHGDKVEQTFFRALCDGNLELVKAMIEDGRATADGKVLGYHPLEIACSRGHLALFDHLVSLGADWKKKVRKNPLLHSACTRDGLPVLERLLTLGQAIDAKGEFGRTALHAAVFWSEDDWLNAGMETVVEFLLEHGASRSATDSDGLDAVGLATKAHNRRALELLQKPRRG